MYVPMLSINTYLISSRSFKDCVFGEKLSQDVWKRGPFSQKAEDAYQNTNPFVELSDLEASPFICTGDATIGHMRVGFLAAMEPNIMSQESRSILYRIEIPYEKPLVNTTFPMQYRWLILRLTYVGPKYSLRFP